MSKFNRFNQEVEPPKAAHERPDNLDPKVNGPFLDDIRKVQEDNYREVRNKKSEKPTVIDGSTIDPLTGRNLGRIPTSEPTNDKK